MGTTNEASRKTGVGAWEQCPISLGSGEAGTAEMMDADGTGAGIYQDTRPCRAALAAASVRLAAPVLVRMLVTWWATVRRLMTSSSATSRLFLPSARSRRTSTSRWVSPSG